MNAALLAGMAVVIVGGGAAVALLPRRSEELREADTVGEAR
jgi:hypothetical protein